ncbi:hypothetical protein [Paenibacillus gansuensis]|uniref:Uncharacterized protein n=1 Tax=Paenibacillus gansuensis TaxID=306542 RepID=A0ABW5PEZ6_9BACL
MQDFLEFMLFSTLEAVAIFVLLLKLFRFDLKYLVGRSIFAGVNVTVLSWALRNNVLPPNVVPVVILVAIILFLTYVFEIQLFYAAIMGATGYIFFMTLQVISFITMDALGWISPANIAPTSADGFILQTGTVVLTIAVATALHLFRVGFTFIPDGSTRYKNSGVGKVLLITAALAIVSVFAIFSIYSLGANLYIIFVLFIVILIPMIIIQMKREREGYHN